MRTWVVSLVTSWILPSLAHGHSYWSVSVGLESKKLLEVNWIKKSPSKYYRGSLNFDEGESDHRFYLDEAVEISDIRN